VRVFCFAEKARAEKFQAQFGGEWFDPRENEGERAGQSSRSRSNGSIDHRFTVPLPEWFNARPYDGADKKQPGGRDLWGKSYGRHLWNKEKLRIESYQFMIGQTKTRRTISDAPGRRQIIG
jgi:hypothetical protein